MSSVELFCGISSLGLPFPKENKEHIGYYDIIYSKLSEEGFDVSGFNMSRLNKNRTWDLEKALVDNISLADLKTAQLESIDALREANPLFKIIVPKSFKNQIKITPDDCTNTLRDLIIKAQQPIFLYHSGVNDFFTYIRSGPIELAKKKVRKALPNNLEELVDKCVDNCIKNWILLRELNGGIHIYAFGFMYSPLYDKIQRLISLQDRDYNYKNSNDNPFLKYIDLFNSKLSIACNKYDYVDYCDITFLRDYCAPMDFHPNTIGNQLMADILLKKIKIQIKKDSQIIDNNQNMK